MRVSGKEDGPLDVEFEGKLILANWSPDGDRLVMTSRDTGGVEPLYEYELSTSELRQLFRCSDSCLGDDEPAYAPDGSEVVFVRALGPLTESGPTDCALWVGEVASGDVRQLTSTPGCSHRETFPHWSPDGTMLVYHRGVYDAGGIVRSSAVYVLDIESGQERQLTKADMFAADADWSPSGDWIVFSTHALNDFECCQTSDLYRVHPDGTGLEPLTGYQSVDRRATQPRYTPDGNWFVFTYVTPSSRSIWAMPAEGGKPFEVVSGGIYTHPTVQP